MYEHNYKDWYLGVEVDEGRDAGPQDAGCSSCLLKAPSPLFQILIQITACKQCVFSTWATCKLSMPFECSQSLRSPVDHCIIWICKANSTDVDHGVAMANIYESAGVVAGKVW